MAMQSTKIIDVTRSYIPLDPRAFPENYHAVDREDYPEKRKEVVAFEGYNFLPTSYGYKSYFGVNSLLNIDALPPRVDEIFIVQTNTFENIAVALTENGIWTKDAGEVGAWVHEVVLDAVEEGKHLDWSYAIIGKDLFCYRQGDPSYWRYSSNPSYFESGELASGVTGNNITFTADVNGLDIGTYTYSIAYFSAEGELSLPTANFSITNASKGFNTIEWNKIPTATKYRLYQTVGSVVTYIDIPQPLGGVTEVSFTHIVPFDIPNAGTLPDLSLQVDVEAYTFYSVVPTFLNMTGQIGLFRAGSRLAFWDSEDSIAWSSIDDFADFTPSVTTLAGSAIFQVVNGRIVNILSSGDGFVIYATKSIVLIARSLESTFQFDPLVLVTGAGIAFKKEVCSAVTDTIQFAYTTNGLYKIEDNKASIIVTEVTDFLKESSAPVYPKIIEGRYLFLQIIDPLYIDGLVGFSRGQVPPTVYTFPGADSSTEDIGDVNLSGNDFCQVLSNFSNGLYGDQQAAGEAARVAADAPPKAFNAFYKPQWTCFLSKDYGETPLVFDGTTCSVPNPNGGTLFMTPTALNYTNPRPELIPVAGEDAYIDGWTMERFIQIQNLIWDIEEGIRQDYLAELGSRVQQANKKTSQEGNVLPAALSLFPSVPEVFSYCVAGEMATAYSMPYFTISPCSFALTRLEIGNTKLNVIKKTKTDGGGLEYGWGELNFPVGDNFYESLSEAASASNASFPNVYAGTPYKDSTNIRARAYYFPSGDLMASLNYIYKYRNVKTEYVSAFNRLESSPVTLGGIDSPYCKITHWKYTDVVGVERTIPAASCITPTPDRKPSGTVNGAVASEVLDDTNGMICSIPFDPITLPAIQDDELVWPDQTVTIPASSFLLQRGSIGPVYPDFFGALIYDLQLQKWGKMKNIYKLLVDWSPINNLSGNNIPYEVFGMQGGILSGNGKISLFDENPIDSYIKYGKIGYWRQGMTSAEEIRLTFRSASDGVVELKTSLDGSREETMLSKIDSFVNATEVVMYPRSAGRWHTVTIKGNYDIKHLEFRGTIVGNR